MKRAGDFILFFVMASVMTGGIIITLWLIEHYFGEGWTFGFAFLGIALAMTLNIRRPAEEEDD